MRNKTKKSGFTLIELLFYTGIASSILLVSTLFLQMLLESRVKQQTISEVDQQGLQVMQIVTQTVRNAENITSPLAGESAALLRLDVHNTDDDPTVFDVSGGVLRITEGAGAPVALTNGRVAVSSLTVENLSRIDTPGIIRVSFVLTYVNPTGRREFDFSKTFYASASLRQP